METTNEIVKPRRMWIVVLLGLLAGAIAQVYVGRFRRAVFVWLGEVLFGLLVFFALITFRLEGLASTVGLLALCVLLYRVFIIIDAGLIARRDRQVPLKRYQRWWLYPVFWVVMYAATFGMAFVFKTFVAEAFVIPANSMSPTIQAGDRILVDKFWTSPEQIQRYDVIVFRMALSEMDSGKTAYVKRVIGLPGETIEVKDEQVLIDGKPIDDPYAECIPQNIDDPLLHDPHSSLPPELAVLVNYGPTKIPEDCFFVMGDNRHLSKDSRMFGPVSFSNYIGTARLIYWSREYTCPFPHKPDYRVPGPMRWERVGTRLD